MKHSARTTESSGLNYHSAHGPLLFEFRIGPPPGVPLSRFRSASAFLALSSALHFFLFPISITCSHCFKPHVTLSLLWTFCLRVEYLSRSRTPDLLSAKSLCTTSQRPEMIRLHYARCRRRRSQI